MELQGKVIVETPVRSGTSARGEWKAKDFVIETHDTYPKKLVFSVFGEDRLQRYNIKIGDEILVLFDIDAKEYNGRWFNNIRAYDVRQVDAANYSAGSAVPPVGAQPMSQSGSQAPFPPQPSGMDDGTTDDLPF